MSHLLLLQPDHHSTRCPPLRRENRGYTSFDDFLMALKQSKRKNIRQERKHVAASGLRLERLRGADLKPAHWDAFYRFYRNTTGANTSPPLLCGRAQLYCSITTRRC